MPRFVLLLHECPHDSPRPSHCDLMLEVGDGLQTWALAELPRDWRELARIAPALRFSSSNSCVADQLAVHRLAYLEFEGPIIGDRGTVRRLDTGTFCSGQMPFAYILEGQLIHGQIELLQTPDTNQWQLTFTPAPS
jgi:hypothetical protein